MEPAQLEFAAEEELISILPNFTEAKLYLISGDVGPFSPQIPVKVPVWLAVNLKERHKCTIITPEWLDPEFLKEKKTQELASERFTPPIHQRYLELSQIILGVSAGVVSADEVRTLIRDIWDIRSAKLRKAVNMMIKRKANHAEVNNLTVMELNTVRALFLTSLDHLSNLQEHAKKCVQDHTT